MEHRDSWGMGVSFAEFVQAAAPEHRPLWEGVYRTARVPEWALGPLPSGRKLLALAEDWCIDTSSTLPLLARWSEQVPGLELRILRRDAHPALMDRYLTGGAKAIPVVIVLDESFTELGHWGPYAAPLAAWVREHKPPVLPKEEFVKGKRVWYARDRGESTLREVLAVVRGDRAGSPRSAA